MSNVLLSQKAQIEELTLHRFCCFLHLVKSAKSDSDFAADKLSTQMCRGRRPRRPAPVCPFNPALFAQRSVHCFKHCMVQRFPHGTSTQLCDKAKMCHSPKRDVEGAVPYMVCWKMLHCLQNKKGQKTPPP